MLEGLPLGAQDVVAAYRLFLARDPENSAIVAQTLERFQSWGELRRYFLDCSEFRGQLHGGVAMDWPRIGVEAEVSPAVLQQMFGHVQRTWEELGRSEPYWSVLSTDSFRTDQMASATRQEEFYESGREVVSVFKKVLQRNAIEIGRYRSCIDFGCGVGRITRWLAGTFERLYGIDVSSKHLALARDQFHSHGITNVELMQLDRVESIRQTPMADVIFSIIVLQHNPPPVIAYVIGELLRKLNHGGVGYFQVPTYALGYAFDAVGYLNSRPSSSSIEMHVLPQTDIFRVIEQAGCRLLEIREDGWVGLPTWISNTFLVQKIVAVE